MPHLGGVVFFYVYCNMVFYNYFFREKVIRFDNKKIVSTYFTRGSAVMLVFLHLLF